MPRGGLFAIRAGGSSAAREGCGSIPAAVSGVRLGHDGTEDRGVRQPMPGRDESADGRGGREAILAVVQKTLQGVARRGKRNGI